MCYATLLQRARPSRVSHTSSSSLLRCLIPSSTQTKVDVSLLASDARLDVLPSCNGRGCYQLNPGLHICQSPHAPFTPCHANTNTALMHFKKILACLKDKGSMNI